ncbi:MAG: hypothetical protein WDW38_005924 [Sanguina aurantia]
MGKVKWAIAGRNAARLEEVKQELIRINPSCKDTPVLIGDIKDEASIGRILQQAQVVVSTAGPFAAYGDVIVDQALAQGTHYCDITGGAPSGTDRPAPFKPVYVKEGGTWTMPFFMSPVNSQIAHYSDALTSHSYGKDFHVLEVMALGSGWSGYLKAWLGTGLMGIAAALVFVKMLRPIADRILPVPGQGPSMKLQRELGHWEHNLVAVTEGPNPKIFKGKVEDLATGLRCAEANRLCAAMVGCQQGHLGWQAEGIATQDAKRDPGYWGTSRMVLEAGLCLVEDAEKLKEAGYAAGGVLTPATAMGTVLITRLQAAGIRFEVTERG